MGFCSRLFGKPSVPTKASLEHFLSSIELEKIIGAYESGTTQTPAIISLLTLYTVHRFCSGISPILAARTNIESMIKSQGVNQEISYDVLAFETAVYCHFVLLKEYIYFDTEDDNFGESLKEEDEYYDTLMMSARVTDSLIEKDTQFNLAKDYFLKKILMSYGRPTRSGDNPTLTEVMSRFEKNLIASVVKGLPTISDTSGNTITEMAIKPYIPVFHSSYLNPLIEMARNIFEKKFLSKEIKELLASIAEVADKFDNAEKITFQLVKTKMEEWAFFNQKELFQIINENCNGNPHVWIYSTIGNITGDLLETGNYHVYRGLLNPVGDDLLKLFDASQDELLQMKILDKNYVVAQKEGIRENIRQSG